MTPPVVQRFVIVNLDRREYLNPEAFGDGPKLLEFGGSGSGVMLGLAILLATGCDGRVGEIPVKSSLVGSWAEHRIAIAGNLDLQIFTDLKETERRILPIGPSLYETALLIFTDISGAVVRLLSEDPYEAKALRNRGVLDAKTP